MQKWLLVDAQAAIKDVLEQLKQSTLQLTHSLKVCAALANRSTCILVTS